MKKDFKKLSIGAFCFPELNWLQKARIGFWETEFLKNSSIFISCSYDWSGSSVVILHALYFDSTCSYTADIYTVLNWTDERGGPFQDFYYKLLRQFWQLCLTRRIIDSMVRMIFNGFHFSRELFQSGKRHILDD